jgi:hypothetical protein
VRAGWAEATEAERDEVKKVFAELEAVKEFRSAISKARSQGGADPTGALSRMQQNYRMTSSLLKTGYDSTMTQLAAMRNWSGSGSHWSYRPR